MGMYRDILKDLDLFSQPVFSIEDETTVENCLSVKCLNAIRCLAWTHFLLRHPTLRHLKDINTIDTCQLNGVLFGS